MIRATEMTKVSIVGPKSTMPDVIRRLYELGILHIDEYTDEMDAVDIGSPDEHAEELSERLLNIRMLRNKLPTSGATEDPQVNDMGSQLDDLLQQVEDLTDERDEIIDALADKRALADTLETLERLGLNAEDVTGYDHIDTYIGTVRDTRFEQELPDGRYELRQDGDLIGLFVDTAIDVEEHLRQSGFSPIELDGLEELDNDDIESALTSEIRSLEARQNEIDARLEQVSSKWSGYLEDAETGLGQELERAEAPLQFATTENAFIAEGWLPTKRLEELAGELDRVSDGRIFIEELELEEHEAPVEHDNPSPIDNFESLIGIYNTPSYKEVDPTFLLLTFPLLFGFMLGDVGYGLTTFIVFFVLYKKFPEVGGLWKSLMFASAATIVFGLAYAEMFGYIIFGHDNVLTALTGIQLFAQIPVIFHRAHELSTVLMLSLAIGVAHVNLGYIIGAYNEYISHGLMEAIFAKLSWIVIEIGAVVWYLTGSMPMGVGVMVAGVLMLYKGEGIEGVVELPSLLSNILSYLRIFGVSVAIVALAAVVNNVAGVLFQSGSAIGIAFGVLLLIVGHTINTFLKMIEAGLQGIRLHYVEFFTKFFHGGGQYYNPFGGRKP